MVIQKGFAKQLVGPILLLTLMVGCNEQEFYEKSFLQGAGVDRPEETSPVDDAEFGDPIADIEPDVVPDPNDGGSTDVGDNTDGGSNNGGDTTDSGDNTDVADNNDGDANNGGDTTDSGDNTDVADNNDGDANNGGDTTDSGDNTDVADNNDGDANNGGDTTDSGDNTDVADNNDGDNDGDANNGGDTTDSGDGTDVADNNDGDNGDGDDQTDPTPAPSLANVIDQFTQAQEKRSKVDILWVIDDSGSMGDEQAALAYNFDAFINGFLNENVDFKMGITTTDGTSRGDGKWAINYKHLTREQANKDEDKFLRDFKRSVQVGTRGSAREMGLKTAQRFLERYNSRIPDPFLRDDAYLIIVVLSDEEDQSPQAVENYVNFFKSQKTNAAMVKLYSIVAMKKTPYQWETVGSRYMKASDETNGVKHHIKDNFYHILRGMGSQIVELTRSFALSAAAHEGKLVVKVNGQVVDGWSYQEETRSISFAEDKTPAAGSSISVEYQKLIGSH